MTPRPALALLAAALLLPSALRAQEKESGSSSLGDLFNKVKDIKVPESVTNLPTQLQELKESYLKTAETVDALRKEVGVLRSEVEALKNENARLQQAVGTKVAADDRSSLGPTLVSRSRRPVGRTPAGRESRREDRSSG